MCTPLEIYQFSEPDMLIVFLLSLLLALPPIIVYVYLWTSVARFYKEIKEQEEARTKLSKSSVTMRLIGNLMIHQDFPVRQPNSNTNLQILADSTVSTTNKDKLMTSIGKNR